MENYQTRKETLSLKLDNVIEYINNNDGVKPNIYEISNFLISIAELEKESNTSLDELWSSFDKMTRLYNLDNDHVFNKNEDIKKLYTSLHDSAKSKTYVIPIDEKEQMIKKELISKILGVNYYITESLEKDSNFKYNNDDEFEHLNQMFVTYEQSSDEPEFINEIRDNWSYLKTNSINEEKEY